MLHLNLPSMLSHERVGRGSDLMAIRGPHPYQESARFILGYMEWKLKPESEQLKGSRFYAQIDVLLAYTCWSLNDCLLMDAYQE